MSDPRPKVLVAPGRYRLATAEDLAPKPKPSVCRHLGTITDRRGSNCPKGWLRDCEVYGSCTTETALPGVACCLTCADWQADDAEPDRYQPGKTLIEVRSPSAGIGDHLLALCVAEGYRRRHPECEVAFSCPAFAHPWVSLFGGYDRLVTPGSVRAPVVFCDNTGDWPRFTVARKPRWEYWAEQFGVVATPPGIKPVPAAAEEFALPYAHCICIAPWAAFKERIWPLDNWLEVESRLCDLGFRVVILDDRTDRCDRFRVEGKLLGRSAAEVTAVIRGSLCMASNDSGLAHVAGASGVPAVCVASTASDTRIMGCWPSVTQLGERHQGGWAKVRPEDVVKMVLHQVRAHLPPEFPLAKFLEIMQPADSWRQHCWPATYSVLWQTVRELNPRTIAEIGTRAGTSAWIALNACPEASVVTVDLPEPGPGGQEGAAAWARQLLAGRNVVFETADSRTLDRLPECDLFFVDGDHCEAACYSDLCLAERSGAKAILLDDFTTLDVRTAVARFLAEYPHRKGRFIKSQTGLFLIE